MFDTLRHFSTFDSVQMMLTLGNLHAGKAGEHLSMQRLKSDLSMKRTRLILHCSLLIYRDGKYTNTSIDIPINFASTTDIIYLFIQKELHLKSNFDIFNTSTNTKIMMHAQIPDSFFAVSSVKLFVSVREDDFQLSTEVVKLINTLGELPKLVLAQCKFSEIEEAYAQKAITLLEYAYIICSANVEYDKVSLFSPCYEARTRCDISGVDFSLEECLDNRYTCDIFMERLYDIQTITEKQIKDVLANYSTWSIPDLCIIRLLRQLDNLDNDLRPFIYKQMCIYDKYDEREACLNFLLNNNYRIIDELAETGIVFVSASTDTCIPNGITNSSQYCYAISSLEVLCVLPEFTSKLMELYEPKDEAIKTLQGVFLAMFSKSKNATIEDCVKTFSPNNKGQEDTISFIDDIINYLKTEEETTELASMFAVTYNEDDISMHSSKLELSYSHTCDLETLITESLASQNIQVTSVPTYTLLSLYDLGIDKSTVLIPNTISLCSTDLYLQAAVFYHGDRNAGHYITVTHVGELWYMINDDDLKYFNVEELNLLQQEWHPRLLVYTSNSDSICDKISCKAEQQFLQKDFLIQFILRHGEFKGKPFIELVIYCLLVLFPSDIDVVSSIIEKSRHNKGDVSDACKEVILRYPEAIDHALGKINCEIITEFICDQLNEELSRAIICQIKSKLIKNAYFIQMIIKRTITLISKENITSRVFIRDINSLLTYVSALDIETFYAKLSDSNYKDMRALISDNKDILSEKGLEKMMKSSGIEFNTEEPSTKVDNKDDKVSGEIEDICHVLLNQLHGCPKLSIQLKKSCEKAFIATIKSDERCMDLFKFKAEICMATQSRVLLHNEKYESTFIDLTGKYHFLPETGSIQMLDSSDFYVSPSDLSIARVYKFITFESTSTYILLLNQGKYTPSIYIGGKQYIFKEGITRYSNERAIIYLDDEHDLYEKTIDVFDKIEKKECDALNVSLGIYESESHVSMSNIEFYDP